VGDVSELADTIRRVAAGESAIDPQVARRLVDRPLPRPTDDLTEREMEVLALMAEGRSNQAICDRLHVSAKTVEGYVSSIFSKLGLEMAPDDHRRVLAVVAYLGSR
jgi:DNA-binding NarL/FixJ family response regulator